MFAYIDGIVFAKEQSAIILLVGGIGYRIFLLEHVLQALSEGTRTTFYLYHRIKEDSHELYGFSHKEEKIVFEDLISVSGVGPKTAMSALSVASIGTIKAAIAKGDASILKQVSGVGPKTAERVVVELRKKYSNENLPSKSDEEYRVDDEVVQALVGLGYTMMAARKAVNELDPTLSTPQARIKEALKHLAA